MTTDNLDVKEWIRFAQMDYVTAKKMAETHYPPPIEIICYHCQQAAEKILKAYAISNGDPLRKTHDLKIIIDQCKRYSPDFDQLYDICDDLTPHVAASRYPPKDDLTEAEMKIALNNVRAVMEFTMAKFKDAGY